MSHYSPTGDFEKLSSPNEYPQAVEDLLKIPEYRYNWFFDKL